MEGFFKDWGNYPPEYNREIHGPYNPSTYYGKRDTPLGDVKLGELMSWLGRRNKNPRAMAQAIGRTWLKYQMNWALPKRPGPAHIYQIFAGITLIYFVSDYKRYVSERKYRYH